MDGTGNTVEQAGDVLRAAPEILKYRALNYAEFGFLPLNILFTLGTGVAIIALLESHRLCPPSAAKYLQIADFNITQRGLWFDKLFSQKASGASPAREGLARVGRHYAGKSDSINAGMTGDPMQYSCQQNFTILTTDGYWNDQWESSGKGARIKAVSWLACCSSSH